MKRFREMFRFLMSKNILYIILYDTEIKYAYCTTVIAFIEFFTFAYSQLVEPKTSFYTTIDVTYVSFVTYLYRVVFMAQVKCMGWWHASSWHNVGQSYGFKCLKPCSNCSELIWSDRLRWYRIRYFVALKTLKLFWIRWTIRTTFWKVFCFL